MRNPRICESEKIKGFEILKLTQAVEDVLYTDTGSRVDIAESELNANRGIMECKLIPWFYQQAVDRCQQSQENIMN